jgi:hypothetical protein
MKQHLRDEETERLLAAALDARTANVFGRPDSLVELRVATRRKTTRRIAGVLRWRSLPSAVGIVAAAAAVLLIVVGVNWVRHGLRPAAPARPSHSDAPLKKTGFGYSPADYFPAVRSDGQPVIVRASDGHLMRILPRGQVTANRWEPISPMVLSPDGDRVYGVGRQLQDDGKPYPAGTGADHVVFIDLKTNQFTSLATRDGRINGFTLSADGTTFAYSLRGGQDGLPDRDVIYVHDLVHDTDRHFLLAAGQRVTNMALATDGSQLAVTDDGHATAVQLMSTTSGQLPPQQSLGAATCERPAFGPLQWTQSGLYVVRSCTFAGQTTGSTIVRVIPNPSNPGIVVNSATTPAMSFHVCESATGPVIFANWTGGAASIVSKRAANMTPPGVEVANIRLSGPGT